jgi:hypothetical protein
MKGKKGIIRKNQQKQERNSDDAKLDQIGTALVDYGINYSRNVFLVFDQQSEGKLVHQGLFVPNKYQNNNKFQINNCDIVATIAGEKLYIELDGEAIHGSCDMPETIEKKTRERNRRYNMAGLNWFTINESLVKLVGLKNNIGQLSVLIALSYIQKIVAIGDNKIKET